MEIVNFPEKTYSQIGASGDCPHCGKTSVFEPVVNHYEQSQFGRQTAVGMGRCIGCKNYVLIVARRQTSDGAFTLTVVYPEGTPRDNVDQAVPKPIADDFAEAIRCEWIRAYKGAVVLCARAIQASAQTLGAKKKRLTDQIDELFTLGKITEALRDFAHEVRVTRNIGAHPDKDGLEDVRPEDAKDIIQFTREYLHHTYVMPALLEARRKAKSAIPATTP